MTQGDVWRKNDNNLGAEVYNLLWFLHVRPTNRPTVTLVTPFEKMLDTPDVGKSRNSTLK